MNIVVCSFAFTDDFVLTAQPPIYYLCSYKFKARPFDHKLVESNGMRGVDPLKQLPVTEPKAFTFQSDARLEHRRKHEEEKKEKEHIHQQQQEKSNEKVLFQKVMIVN